MNLQKRLKCLRLLRKLSQQQMADQLHLSRSAYTKLEASTTSIRVELLHRIADILRVPATCLMSARADSSAYTSWNDFDFMLEMSYNHLSYELAVVAYDELSPDQLALVTSKGFGSRDAYENTPLQGRLYTYGPRQIIDTMFRTLNMATLFEYHLIQHPTWLRHWENYQLRQDESLTVPVPSTEEPEVDETAYLVVFLLMLTMPDGSEQHLELAQRDIPPGMDEQQALEQLIATRGALDGEIGAFTFDGYTSYTDIVTDIYAK